MSISWLNKWVKQLNEGGTFDNFSEILLARGKTEFFSEEQRHPIMGRRQATQTFEYRQEKILKISSDNNITAKCPNVTSTNLNFCRFPHIPYDFLFTCSCILFISIFFISHNLVQIKFRWPVKVIKTYGDNYSYGITKV